MMQGYHPDKDGQNSDNLIWWSIYNGDRSLSLLLGLPYGFNDAHYGCTIRTDFADGDLLTANLAVMTGRIIDRNLSSDRYSTAKAKELDSSSYSFQHRLQNTR